MQHHLHALRQKPIHVRKNIALAVSALVTALVAVVWVITLASSRALALSPTPSVKPDIESSITKTGSSISKLMGAAGAATIGGATTETPALTIIDGGTTSSLDAGAQEVQQPSATTLTF